MLKGIFKNEKGGALMLTVIASFVILAFTMTTILLSGTSAKQVTGEVDKTQAYYIAKTGAESLVKHLEDMAKEKKDVKKELDDLIAEGNGTGEYNNGEFTIEIKKINEEKYEMKSTGKVNDTTDWIKAELTLEEINSGGGSGLIMGDGAIYVTTSKGGEFQFHNFGQFGNTDLSIYTVNKNVTQINDGTSGYTKTSSTDNGMIKDLFIKKEHTVEMVYNLNRDMVRAKYLDEKLIKGELEGEELKTAIESSYFLPITVENHKAFLADTAIFPEPKYNLPSGEKETKISLPGKGTVDLTESNYVRVTNKLEVGGELNIKTSGNTNIVFNDEVLVAGGSKLKINADGRVNVYFVKRAGTTGGDIEVISPESTMAQVNFYVCNGLPFQAQSGTKVIGGVNLYAPTSDVQLQEKIRWEGIVVANQLEFNDNVQFRAPSAGDDPSDMNKDKNKEIKLKTIEWKR